MSATAQPHLAEPRPARPEGADAARVAPIPAAEREPLNALTVDVEDWFCVHNFSRAISREDWSRCESRVERNTLRLLDLFDRNATRATFFVLGWIAERVPSLVEEIERRGHEVASHGTDHLLITEATPAEFESDLSRSIERLQRIVKQPVRGYRAPSFTLTAKTMWAVGIMKKLGIRYDSSVFPLSYHPDYGIRDAPLDPYVMPEGLLEIPMSIVKAGGLRIPISGGGYFRMYPYRLTRFLLRRLNGEGRKAVFYLHPWEIDPDQPRVKVSALKRFRHYVNLDRTEERLDRLLKDFRFSTVQDAFQSDLSRLPT